MINNKLADVSIKTKYFRIIFILFLAIMLSGIGLFFYINNQQDKLKHDRGVLQHKTETINELAATLNDVFFRARGYVALKSDGSLSC